MAKKARKKTNKKTVKRKAAKPARKTGTKTKAKAAVKRKSKRKVKVKSPTMGDRLSNAYHAVVDSVKGTGALRDKMEKPGTSETE